ncbi:hypothetical protein RI129_008546 [Pyrocoelia pectoralis]|uniref:Uncharacterized protein n=1 Tax=Pyrocoelia pectoralis TaxID=417401 RepID=A0AAN7VFG2_9COLE
MGKTEVHQTRLVDIDELQELYNELQEEYKAIREANRDIKDHHERFKDKYSTMKDQYHKEAEKYGKLQGWHTHLKRGNTELIATLRAGEENWDKQLREALIKQREMEDKYGEIVKKNVDLQREYELGKQTNDILRKTNADLMDAMKAKEDAVNEKATKEGDMQKELLSTVLFSVVDKASYLKAEAELTRLQDADLLRARPAILVANKIDLARSRAVSTQDGKCLACTYRAKFIEISVGINHNVDELLVGILTQIRLKSFHYDDRDHNQQQWYKSRGVVRASMKARQMFTWLFGKEDSKFKNCENLHIL